MTEQNENAVATKPASDEQKVHLIRETRSTIAFLALVVLTLPASLIGAMALLPIQLRIFGLIALVGFIMITIFLAATLAIKYPVVFLGYDHPVVVRQMMHGPPAPGLFVLTKHPTYPAQKRLVRTSGAVIWNDEMDKYVGNIALVMSADKRSMTARLDIDGAQNPWAWEWLDFISISSAADRSFATIRVKKEK